jgi:hypothetical protein
VGGFTSCRLIHPGGLSLRSSGSHGRRSPGIRDRIGCGIATQKRDRVVCRASGGTIEKPTACPALERFAPSKPLDRREDSGSFVDAPEIGGSASLASRRAFPLLDHSWRPAGIQCALVAHRSSCLKKALCLIRSSFSIFYLDIGTGGPKRRLGDQAY